MKYKTQQEKQKLVCINFDSSLQGTTHDASNEDTTESTNSEKEDNECSLSSMHYEDGDLEVNDEKNVNENLYTMSQGYNDRFVADILKKACSQYKSFCECESRS